MYNRFYAHFNVRTGQTASSVRFYFKTYSFKNGNARFLRNGFYDDIERFKYKISVATEIQGGDLLIIKRKKIIILVIIGVAETVNNSYFYLNVNKNENEKYVDKVKLIKTAFFLAMLKSLNAVDC